MSWLPNNGPHIGLATAIHLIDGPISASKGGERMTRIQGWIALPEPPVPGEIEFIPLSGI